MGLKTHILMSINPTRIVRKQSLPASVKGTTEVQSTGARFVVSSGAKAIHKTAVGERSLHRKKEMRKSHFVQQRFRNFHTNWSLNLNIEGVFNGYFQAWTCLEFGLMLFFYMKSTTGQHVCEWTFFSRPDRLDSQQFGCSHQRSFEIWGGGGCPGGRYDAVDLVVLLGVDVLHVERRAVLGLTLGLLRVQAAVHATVAVLSKEGVDGLYPGLAGGGNE